MNKETMEQIIARLLGRTPTEQEVNDFMFAQIENDFRVDEFLEDAKVNDLCVAISQDETVFVNAQFLVELIVLATEPDESGHVSDSQLALAVTIRNLVAAAARSVGAEIL